MNKTNIENYLNRNRNTDGTLFTNCQHFHKEFQLKNSNSDQDIPIRKFSLKQTRILQDWLSRSMIQGVNKEMPHVRWLIMWQSKILVIFAWKKSGTICKLHLYKPFTLMPRRRWDWISTFKLLSSLIWILQLERWSVTLLQPSLMLFCSLQAQKFDSNLNF